MGEKFLYFTFDGVHSSTYNCFYTNYGEDLVFPMIPQFSDSTSSPLFQQHTYYLGTTIQDKVFQLNCVCQEITKSQFLAVQNWLDIERIGELHFDFLNFEHFNVKISNISDVKLYPLTSSLYHYSFTLTFTTISDYAALSNTIYKFLIPSGREEENSMNDNNSIKDLIELNYRLPLIDYNYHSTRYPFDTNTYKTMRFFNFLPYPYYLNMNIESIRAFTMGISNSENDWQLEKDYQKTKDYTFGNGVINTWYDYVFTESQGDVNINGRMGYLTKNNKLIETVTTPSRQENNGSFQITKNKTSRSELILTGIGRTIVDTTQGIELIFDLPQNLTQLYDYGEVDKNNIILENPNHKVILIQDKKIFDYQLYNEEGYSEKKYFVKMFNCCWGYHFMVEDGQLIVQIPITNNINKDLDIYQIIDSYVLNGEYIVTIADYTELEIKALRTSVETTNSFPNINIDFQLRYPF